MAETNLDRLKKIVSKEPSNWSEKARGRNENGDWLEDSFKIALVVLRTLRSKEMSQKELADKMNVSPQQVNKIVKGRENLSLETLSKLKKALGVDFIKIGSSAISNDTFVMQLPNGSSKLNFVIKGRKAEGSYPVNIGNKSKNISLPVFVTANQIFESKEVCDLSN